MLVDEDTLFCQRLEAVAVKLFCEEPFSRAERVCAVDYYQVIHVDLVANEFQPVLIVYGDPWVRELG